jgi:L-threonylcarbamoyladenylate synthase
MRVVRVERQTADDAVAAAVDVLRAGGIVAYPTDTLYGLAVDPRNDAAVARLFEAKGRDAAAAVPLIAADLDQAQEAGTFGDAELRLARTFWPGPLTIVVPARPGLSRRVLGERETVAVRVPAHDTARALAARAGCCITATSANRSRQPATADPARIDPQIAAHVDLLLDDGPAPGGAPSTIVEVTRDGLRLVRAGALAWDRVIKSAR